jgi:hypothetical protein
MELVEAVKKKQWEKVEVRRPLEAGSSTESGPSRAVCLGLGQWALDAVVAARLGLAGSNPALTSGTSQAIVMPHAGARPCR